MSELVPLFAHDPFSEDPFEERVRHGQPARVEDHRGHGPRDYEPREEDGKSDERLREEVCEALAQNRWLDARDMNVGVDEAEVILSGVAATFEARLLAEHIALSVAGVVAVHNFVGIKAGAGAEPGATDEETRPERPSRLS